MQDLIELLNKTTRSGFFSAIDRIFKQMEIAEAEITAAQERHPEHSDAIWRTFRQLQPTAPLKDKSETLYRKHCAELLDRVPQGLSLDPATHAEVLGFISDASQINPPGPTLQYWHSTLFCQLLSGEAATDLLLEAKELAEHVRLFVTQEDLDSSWLKIVRALDSKRPTCDTGPCSCHPEKVPQLELIAA